MGPIPAPGAAPGGGASRFLVRTVAVVLLVVGAAGGVYVGQDHAHRQGSYDFATSSRTAAMEAEALHRLAAADYQAEAPRRAAVAEAEARAGAEARRTDRRVRAAEEAADLRRSGSGAVDSGVVDFGPIPASCGEYGGNRAIGCALLLEWGFGLDEMPCLDNLWTRESGWNHQAANASTGAYGIPQALPGSKMSQFGEDWETNPATQITWGLNYVEGRYGTPCGAWQNFLDTGWY